MKKQEIREIFEKQLQLLSEASQSAAKPDLPALTQSMISIGYLLVEKSFQVEGQ